MRNRRHFCLLILLAGSWHLVALGEPTIEPGFTVLFDGHSFADWEHNGNWVIKDGAFYRQAQGGPLTYVKAPVPDDFELRFDWKVSKGCNSGIYYRPGQYEFQILDNVHSPYGKNLRHAAGALFFCMSPTKDATKPFGEWNTGRIKCKGSVIEHWINGERVLSFDYKDPKWAMQVAMLGLRGTDLNARGGRLWLQDHGHDIWYRNLRWRAIPPTEALIADPSFHPAPVIGDGLEEEKSRVRKLLAKAPADYPGRELMTAYLAADQRPPNPSVRFVQRTMRMLAGERNRGETIRVLFYGQSITAQNWRAVVQKRLQTTYPDARIEFTNKAIGGFTSPRLRGTAEHDLYPYYPDLLIFHVYGDMENFEAIIRKTREVTTAEIVLWTDHLADPSRMRADDAHSQGIREVAAKYDCMLIDVRQKWRAHLTATNTEAKDYLKDAVHLNQAGTDLLGNFIASELIRNRDFGENTAAEQQIRTIALDDQSVQRHADGSLTVSFTGNRVAVISDGSNPEASVTVKLDGKPLHSFPEPWAVTRPSRSAIWMPAIARIELGAQPIAEDWVLTCLDDSSPDGKSLHFKLHGSVTGDDGEGWSNADFTSTSGRIRIAAKDWNVAFPLKYKKTTLPKGFQVKWRTYPTFAANFSPGPAGTETMLVQGIPNGDHVLTITPKAPGKLGIAGFEVSTPGN